MKQNGFIALTTVLVMIPLLLITGIETVYSNITSLLVGKMEYDYQILSANSQTCLEESVYKIKWNPSFTGTVTVDIDDWYCISDITDKTGEPGVKIIDMQLSDLNDIEINIVKELNTNTNPFELSNT
jgi:hypothetical protein